MEEKFEDKFIELRILTGLIVSTDYVMEIRDNFNIRLLESSIIKMVAGWCIEYYDKYQKAPNIEIESIFLKKSKNLRPAEEEDIQDILADLSNEYERSEMFNVKYLIDQTIAYFKQRNLHAFAQEILDHIDNEEVEEAEGMATSYISPIVDVDENLNLADKDAVNMAVSKAFKSAGHPVVKYPRALGRFWNDQLVRGAFIAFMGPEKRGKTFRMLEMGLRGSKQKANVAFFQAGDMTQASQIRRIAISLAKKSDKEKYIGKQYEPVRDCIKNQNDTCDLKQREGTGSVFEGRLDSFFKTEIRIEDIVEAYKENKDHKPCYNCSKFWTKKYGTPWIKEIDIKGVLTEQEAEKVLNNFFVKKKLGFRLSTHANKTLTVSKIDTILDKWEREDGFVVDMVIVDYADILDSELRSGDFRHQENDKWMRLRGLSQHRNCLVVTATQTDADSYDQDILSLKNFSEDKRKFAHVTAMYGLNQDKKGREKGMGIMRINQIVVREEDFSNLNQVIVLQNLARGLPFLASY